MVLIQCQDETVSPTALVAKVLADVEETKEFPSRFINRLIPLEAIAYAGVDEIAEAAKPLIAAHLDAHKAEHEGEASVPPIEVREARGDAADSLGSRLTWCVAQFAVELKRRNCSGLKSMDAITALANLVGPDHKVNLTAPKTVILVEVFRVSACCDIGRLYSHNAKPISSLSRRHAA